MLIEHSLKISLEISAPHAEQAKFKEEDKKSGKIVILRRQEITFKAL